MQYLPEFRSKESIVLYLSMFVIGACGICYEFTFSKVASDLLGNSVRQWAVIIGFMMFFMGVGSDLQKYLSDSNLFDKLIIVEVCLGLLGGFGPIIFLYSFGSYPHYYIIIHYFFIIMVGLLIGFEIPLITRINETYIAELKVNLGGILKMDYIGSFAGALVWIFFLPKFFTLIEMAFVLAILNVFVAALTFLYFNASVGDRKTVGAFIALSLFGLLFGGLRAEAWTSYAEQYLYRDRIILSETTPYQHIVLTEDRSKNISCYINGNVQFNSFDEFIYHENMVHPAFALAPHKKKVLVLGGGDGLALREILKYPEVESVTLCDIDPAMTELAANSHYFTEINKNSLKDSRLTILKNNALIETGREELIEGNQNYKFQKKTGSVGKIKIINMDAAQFIEQISGVYDIIIIDFPDPNTPELSKLYSKKFYRHIQKKLSANGIMVQQASSPVYAKEAFLCIGRTMKDAGLAVIPYHDNVPSFGEWGWWIGGREDRVSEKDLRKKLYGVRTIPVETQYLTPALIRASLHFGKGSLSTENKDINTIFNNKVYYYYLDGWERFS